MYNAQYIAYKIHDTCVYINTHTHIYITSGSPGAVAISFFRKSRYRWMTISS